MRHPTGSPESQGWVYLSNTFQTEPRDVLCFVHNNESFTFPTLFFLSVLFYGTISEAPGFRGVDTQLGAWVLSDSMKMMLACLESPTSRSLTSDDVLAGTLLRTCHRVPATVSSSYSVAIPLSLVSEQAQHIQTELVYLFIITFNIIFIFFLWAILPLLVQILHRNHWFECKIPLKHGYFCFCNPWGFWG